jgi:SEC-C motif-containing protein
MAASTPQDNCPCGSDSALAACCLPLIQGKKKASTAEELLRSRYTAFTRGDVDYILATHHSSTQADVKREEIEDWSKHSEWHGLQIVQSEAGKAEDDKGTIAFCAKHKPLGKGSNPADVKVEDHWEQAMFEKENGQWKFLDARGINVGTYKREEPKIGRNDPCPCESGKKYKKCCGA